MPQSKTQAYQIVLDTAQVNIGSAVREGLDTIFTKVDALHREVGGLSVTGSSAVVSVDLTTLAVGPNGRRKGLAPVSGVDVGGLSGTFNLSTGVGTSAVQTATLPTFVASGWVRVGFEVRTDKRIYALYGTPNVVFASAGLPGFSSGSIPLGEVQVQTNASSLIINPTMGSIVLFGTGSGGGGSGSGTGVRNYVDTADAEIDVSKFATYADAAGASPVDGIGGTPTLTLTRNTINPLIGAADYQINKPASNAQGQGVSSELKTVNVIDRGGAFDILVPFKAGAGFVANDVSVFLIDVTGGSVVQLYAAGGFAIGTGVFRGRINSTLLAGSSYRLVFHVASVSAVAYTVNFDEPIVTPVDLRPAVGTEIFQTAHGFTTGKAVYWTGSVWALADAADVTKTAVGIVAVVPDANRFHLVTAGFVPFISTTLISGQYYYLSGDATGNLILTDIALVSQPLFLATSTSSGFVIPYRPTVESDPDYASPTQDGIVSVAAQTFAGTKTFQNGVISADGSATAPSYAFGSSATTGLFRKAAGSMGFASAGVEIGSFANGGAWSFGVDGVALHTLIGAEMRRIAGAATGNAAISFYSGIGAGTLRATIGVAGVASGIVTGAVANDFAINMASGSFLVGGAGAIIGSATNAGAWTLGSASDAPYTTFHTINKSLFSGTPSSAADLNGSIRFGSNSYSVAGNQPTRVSGLTGVQIAILNRTSDTTGACFFQANLAADTVTTASTTVGNFTAQGAWTFGPNANYTNANRVNVRINGGINFRYPVSDTIAHAIFVDDGTNIAGHVPMLFHSNYTSTAGNRVFSWHSGAVSGTTNEIGYATHSGAWVFGRPSNEIVVHGFSGAIDCRSSASREALLVYRRTAVATDFLMTLYSDVGGVGIKFRVESDGDVISVTNSYTSDERAKKNIVPIQYGLAEIMQLQPIGYQWKHEDDTDIQSFSAGTTQNIQSVLPEMVREDGLNDEIGGTYKAVYDREIVAVLVKAIQELKAELDIAKAQIAAMAV